MRKTLITLGLCFAFSAFTFAQETDVRYEINQYGQQVRTVPAEVTIRNGVPTIANRNEGFRFWFDTRVQIDGAWYHNLQNGPITGDDGRIAGFRDPDARGHMPGGLSLRRVRFAIKAQIDENWYGEIDFNAANGEFGLQDAYIEFNGFSDWRFRLGNFKEDFSMEYTTSSRFVTMMERPMAITAFNFTRRLGFQVQYHPQSNPWLRVTGGVTFQEIDDIILRSNIVGNMQERARGSGPNFTGKIVLMPWATNPNQGLHFGYNIQHRSGTFFDDDQAITGVAAANSRGWHSMRVSSRNATAVHRLSFLDTRWINGVRSNLFQGFELAGFWNGWRFGSELIIHDMRMDRDLFNFPTFTQANADAATAWAASNHPSVVGTEWAGQTFTPERLTDIYAQDKRFWGFYAYVGKLLFGGRQRYDLSQSEFTQPTRGRSWGDIEVKFRYDFLNLNNNHRDRPIHSIFTAHDAVTGQAGGSAHNFTLGVSYWISSSMRFTVNYTITQNDRFSNAGANQGARRNVAVGRDSEGYFTGNPFDVDPARGPTGVNFNTLQARIELWF